MSITIEYKDGSVRIINPVVSFFAVDERELIAKKLKKEDVLLERIKNLASATGIVYKVTCVLNNQHTLEYTNPKNEPETKRVITPDTYSKWRAKRKKMLKDMNAASLRKIPFSICTNPKRKLSAA